MITLEGGKEYEPKPDDPVYCEEHGVTVLWGDLSSIQKAAVAEGLDVDGRCILLPPPTLKEGEDG